MAYGHMDTLGAWDRRIIYVVQVKFWNEKMLISYNRTICIEIWQMYVAGSNLHVKEKAFDRCQQYVK